MIQLPNIIYATGKDFMNDNIESEDLLQRIEEFSNKFIQLGTKLL